MIFAPYISVKLFTNVQTHKLERMESKKNSSRIPVSTLWAEIGMGQQMKESAKIISR
jgi:hypothetical protein